MIGNFVKLSDFNLSHYEQQTDENSILGAFFEH
jgi:hypothetical protein